MILTTLAFVKSFFLVKAMTFDTVGLFTSVRYKWRVLPNSDICILTFCYWLQNIYMPVIRGGKGFPQNNWWWSFVPMSSWNWVSLYLPIIACQYVLWVQRHLGLRQIIVTMKDGRQWQCRNDNFGNHYLKLWRRHHKSVLTAALVEKLDRDNKRYVGDSIEIAYIE